MYIFNNPNIDDTVLDYFRHFNLTEEDFYCKTCGKPLFDFSILEEIVVKKLNGYVIPPVLFYKNSKKKFMESDDQRWTIVGRFLSGKRYQRKVCWDCFFESLPKLILEKKSEIKNKWMIKLRTNDLRHIPISWQSPAFYFTLIFDISDEDLKKEMDKFVTASPEFFKKKFGDRWEEEYEKYRKVQAKAGCSLEYFVEKYGEEEGKRRYEEVNANKAMTKANCIRKYGKEEGLKVWNDYCEKQEYAGCKLEYFIEKYGEEAGTKFYYDLNHKKAITLENMIRVHGEEEGKNAYYTWLANAMINGIGYSKVSQELFEAIDEKLGSFAESSHWALKNSEVEIEAIVDGIPKWIKPDYLLNKKIIEFNGDYWHANPQMYEADDIIPFFNDQSQVARDIWNRDFARAEALKELGYTVKTVWENDYYKNPYKCIKSCVEFLKS